MQKDVAPYTFVAHRHSRGVLDETGPSNISLDLPIFGTPSIKKKKAASIVNPSLTDNMEFMSVKTLYDEKSNRHTVKVDYHHVASEDPDDKNYKNFSPDVIAAVEALKDSYRSHAYRDFSQLKTDPLKSLFLLLSTDHSSIVALDAIPIMIAQFEQTLEYTRHYLTFLIDDLGEENPIPEPTAD